MIALTAISSVIVFILTLWISGLAQAGYRVLATVRDSVAIMRDASIDDERREKKLQQSSLQLFRAFFSILIRSALVFLLSLLPIFISSLLGLAEIEDVIRYLSRWDFIIITTVIICACYAVWTRLRPSSTMIFQMNYSTLDRLLHHVAFSAQSIQFTAADIEKKAFSSEFEAVEAEKPIFIASLPRAGTTLLLEVLHRFPSLATHTYRDMPFIMAPLLWSKLNSAFHKPDKLRERAHGDGMVIGYNSPEAFEEIIWRAFWPEKYTDTNIELWDSEDSKGEASSFFVEHIKKIIALRRPDRARDGRYLSKNNANIARLDLISRMFPKAKILIPVRHPVEQAASLLRQHLNFIEMHKNEPFIRRYMADIGHYEFGALHRPIAFPGIDVLIHDRDPLTLNYWLGYWIAAFEYVLERREAAMLISYEVTCSNGRRALAEICLQLEIPEEGMLDTVASIIKVPPPPRGDKVDCDSRLLSHAEELYKALIA